MSQRFHFNLSSLYLSVILILGIFLRFYHLDKASLWFDEAGTILKATESKGMFSSLLAQNHPLAFFEIFVYYWSKIGNSEFILRLPSAIFGVIGILFIFFLGRLIFDNKTGLISAFILSISPFHIHYSQEIRMYAFIVLFSTLSVYSFVKLLKTSKDIYVISYIFFNILNIYIHPLTIYLLLSQLFFFLLFIKKYKILLRKWFASHILIFCSILYWLINIKDGLDIKTHWWVSKPGLKSIFFTFKNFSIGYNAGKEVYLCLTIIFLLLAVYGIIKRKDKKEEFALLSICLLFPILMVFISSQFKSYYLDRYFIPFSIFYYILIGKGLSCVKNIYIGLMLIVITISTGISLKNYYNNFLPSSVYERLGITMKQGHREAANYIIKNFQKGDIVFHTCENTTLPFEYYFDRNNIFLRENEKKLVLRFSKKKGELSILKYGEEFKANKFLPSDEMEYIGFIDNSKNILLENYNRIWLVFSDWNFDLNKFPQSSELRIMEWLNKDFTIETSNSFPGIEVYLYKRKNV